ncbi:MAG: exodeoxyribonuclease V subunit alpha [Xanthomonadaceae bacterium]|nr:exodeoxyribonuclease V subunit alpha [Xanthomonadaceae bacterium]
MNTARFPESDFPGSDFASSDFEQALSRWVRRRSGSDLLARAAAAIGHAQTQGHVRCDLAADAGFSATEIEALRTHAWVGSGDAFAPFVCADGANMYTWRNWRHETRLAQALLARAGLRLLPLDAQTLMADVDALFSGTDAKSTRWQRAAVAAAPGARVFVLSGGPGTGKTSTVLRMLLMLLKHAQACGWGAHPAIALAAPTGKAAQRLTESIARGRAALAGSLVPDSPFMPMLEHVRAAQTQTLHRLLGFSARTGEYAFHADAPLAADIVVVDEASMIDLAMMRRLFDALRPNAVLILLGDPAQLYAIEAGCVLGDVVGSVAENALPEALAKRLSGIGDFAPTPDAAVLAGQALTLTHTWRASAGLRDALAALRRGDQAWLERVLAGNGEDDLDWRACADGAAVRERVRAWMDAHAEFFESLMRPEVAPADALRTLQRAQILCALRDGAFGTGNVNALIERQLAARFGFDADAAWHHGRPVIVARNDYARGLYNGDVGIALEDAEGLRVWFDGADGAPRSFSPRALPAHETAWAITIHRSQGSEYDEVAVLLPADPEHRILSRELVYTAVSRARKRVQLWSSAEALCSAVARRVARRSGLRERLSVSRSHRESAGAAIILGDTSTESGACLKS